MAEPEPIPDSALAHMTPRPHPDSDGRMPGLGLVERIGLQIWQVAAWHPEGFAELRPRLAEQLGCPAPDQANQASTSDDLTVFWTAPHRWLIVSCRKGSLYGPLSAMTEGRAALTDLGHARTVVRLAGQDARTVLTKVCRIDLHPSAFPPGHAAQTTLANHVAALIHARADPPATGPMTAGATVAATTAAAAIFDLYLPRSYARSATATLLDAATEFGVDRGPGSERTVGGSDGG